MYSHQAQVLMTIALILHPLTPAAAVPPAQQNALLDFKQHNAQCGSTDTLTSWTRGSDVSTWDGLEVTADNRLVSISFTDTPLCAALPPSWSSLNNLLRLHVNNTGITGTLPREWSVLTQLEEVGLPSNLLHGPIPTEWSTLTRLTVLDLDLNRITGQLPASFSTLTNLRLLWLTGNSLKGPIPAAWSNMASLAGLVLYNNSLTGTIPSSFSALQSLRYFHVRSNHVRGTIPKAWSTMSNFSWFEASNNMLTGPLPTAWSALSRSLWYIGLGNNSLTGTIPSQWSSLTNLEILAFHTNKFESSLPSEWGTLHNLRFLNAMACGLRGPIPASWHNTTIQKLTYFELSGNQLTGPMPPIPVNATIFNISHNQLTGTMPPIPPGVLYVDVQSNKLTGPIPAPLPGSNLTFLNLDNNRLTALPAEFNAPNAVVLSAVNNSLSGPIPTWPSSQHSLLFCDLSNNSLTGSLPPSIAAHNWLYLALDNNKLSSVLPHVWEGAVQVLLFRNNSMRGCLPPIWTQNSTLRVLALSGNQLSCDSKTSWTLPTNWASSHSFPSLALLDLNDNPFSGNIPEAWLTDAAFNKSNPELRLGNLWTHSAERSESWRRDVCISERVNARINSFVAADIPQAVYQSFQQYLDSHLTNLTEVLADQDSLMKLNPPDISTRMNLKDDNPFTLKSICTNSYAVLIVCIQWGSLIGVLLGLVAFYFIAKHCRWFEGVREMGPNAPFLYKIMNSGLVRTCIQRLSFISSRGRYIIAFIGYWVDIATDIILIADVWGKWPGWALFGVFIFQYLLSSAFLSYRVLVSHGWHGALTALPMLLVLPVLPLLDTAAFCMLALQDLRCVNKLPFFSDWLLDWQGLFDMREVMEVFLEAIPTSLLQSIVFVMGNSPYTGWYLSKNKYIISAAISFFQIVRLTATVVVEALQRKESPVRVLWMFASYRVKHLKRAGGKNMADFADVESLDGSDRDDASILHTGSGKNVRIGSQGHLKREDGKHIAYIIDAKSLEGGGKDNTNSLPSGGAGAVGWGRSQEETDIRSVSLV